MLNVSEWSSVSANGSVDVVRFVPCTVTTSGRGVYTSLLLMILLFYSMRMFVFYYVCCGVACVVCVTVVLQFGTSTLAPIFQCVCN